MSITKMIPNKTETIMKRKKLTDLLCIKDVKQEWMRLMNLFSYTVHFISEQRSREKRNGNETGRVWRADSEAEGKA